MSHTRYSPTTMGFYAYDIDYPALPADVIDVDAETYHALFTAQANGQTIQPDATGKPIAVDPVSILTLEQMKSRKLTELAAEFTQCMGAIRAGYPNDEIQSWANQQSEAAAYTADKNTAIPLLSAMASARGITIDDLAARVIANALAFSVAAGTLIGKRQKYEDAVMKATDASGIASIVWEY